MLNIRADKRAESHNRLSTISLMSALSFENKKRKGGI